MNIRIKQIFAEYLRVSWPVVLILVIFFIAGVTFGAIGAKSLDQSLKEDLSQMLQKFFVKLPDAELDNREVVKDSLLKNLYLVLGMYLLGLSVVGSILVPIVVFTRGFTLGFTIGFIVYDRAWKGVLLAVVSILPQNIMLIPALLLSGLLTLTFSFYFARGRLMFRAFESGRPVLFYSLGMCFTAMLTVGGCILESYVTPSLIKYSAAFLTGS